MKAIWNNQVIAESNDTIVVENNHYFPPDAVNKEYLQLSDTHTTCLLKGLASYYTLQVNDTINKNAAWHYPKPKEVAKEIKNRIGCWKGVKVELQENYLQIV
ncbi:DUF427 domain-containing protein [Ilyomonas limi]|uniref:DUF427 domain-containing protein n=1 Tax=Ilyomonas limi TaxID=2575867 RepID=A0A4U3L0L0_9BACT|nr:DUF427 domain-containing protein [Ilyomonas limi]TKK66977.1 DUF427 domain-containing protein [Ilyomonas limi]